MKLAAFILGLISFSDLAFAQDSTYNAVSRLLLNISELDQRYRNQVDFIETKYGRNSKELKNLYQQMDMADSTNLVQVDSILKIYGWLGADKIGSQANTALFLVIQHAKLSTQKKYLPLMREAVGAGTAHAQNLAILEDRVAVFEGKTQSYGSQLFWSEKNNRYFILPLTDPDNVDKRRSEVGLQPLSAYVSKWNIQWNVEEYKNELPALVIEWKTILQKIELE